MTGARVLPLVRCGVPTCSRRARVVVDGVLRCGPCAQDHRRLAAALDVAQANWTAALRRAAMTIVRDPDPALVPTGPRAFPSAEAS